METNILDLPKDVMVLLALELSLPEILAFCRSNKKFDKYVCENDEFWRNKWKKDFKGFYPIPKNKKSKQYYESIQRQINEFPKYLPINPSIYLYPNPENDVFLFLHESLRIGGGDGLCHLDESWWKLCQEEETWKRMLRLFYPHLKGNFMDYMKKYYPDYKISRMFYHKIMKNPKLIQTGFF